MLGKSRRLCHTTAPAKLRGMKLPQQSSREAIDDFKAIYKDEFGRELSDNEVQEIALRLLHFFGTLTHSVPDKTRTAQLHRSRALRNKR